MRLKNQPKILDTKLKLTNLIQILIGLAFLNVTMLMLIPNYLQFSTIESLSYFTDDGWCKTGEGIGKHCFGDFYYNFNFTDLSAPWGQQRTPYPPLSLFIFKIFKFLFENTSYSRLSINTYLIISVIAILFPSYHLQRKGFINKKISFVIGTTTIMSAPMIASLDRGNLQMIVTPLIYLCVYYFFTNNKKYFLLTSCILVSLKPQYILLATLFIAKRDYINLFKWLTATVISFLSTFVLYPVNILQNLQDYVNQISLYNQYVPTGILYPANLSLSSTLSLIYRFFSESNLQDMQNANSFFVPIWITVLILTLCSFLLWRAGPNTDRYTSMYLALSFPILLPGVVFAYHASTLVVFFIFIAVNTLGNNPESFNKRDLPTAFVENKISYFLTSSIVVLLFIPFSIPWNLIPRYTDLADGNVTITWTLLQFLFLVLFIKLMLDVSKSKKVRILN
jgi:hypothetical protein